MALGGLLLVGGAGLTAATMSGDGGGAVFYGAMAVGVGLLIKGVMENRQGKAAEEQALAHAARQASSQIPPQATPQANSARSATPQQAEPVSGTTPTASATPSEVPTPSPAATPEQEPASRLPRPSSEQTEADPEAYYAILSMIAVAIADGEINGSEKTFIRLYPPETIGARIAEENIYVFASMLHQEDIVSQLEKAKDKLTPEGRETAVRLSIMTALADGGMSGVEEKQIVAIANCLGVAGERLQGCVDRAHSDYADFVNKHNAEN